MNTVHILKSIRPQREISSFDHIYYDGIFGSVRDTYVLEDEVGNSYIPCALVYFLDENGTRQSKLFEGKFTRDLKNYYEDAHKLIGTTLSDNLMFDPISQQYFTVMPFDNFMLFEYDDARKKLPKETPVIFKAKDGFDWAELNNDVLLKEEKIIRRIKQVSDKFGLYGSTPINLDTETADIDILLYGKTAFDSVTPYFSERQNMDELGINIACDYKQMLFERYCKRFNIDRILADKIISEKPRYITSNKTILSFDVTGPTGRDIHTILQTKRVTPISLIGEIVDNKEAHYFPREYLVEFDNIDEPVRVISHQWATIKCAKQGEDVAVRGTLRQNADGEQEIFLETDQHYILPQL